jgi:glutathionylspermidine synthase
VVLNPAYTMLLQSKAIMKFMYELAPNLKYNLKTSFKEGDFPDRRYVRKPMFGRMGDNIAFYDGNRQPEYETEGDYGDYPPVYQELADFNADSEEHRYQPSIFWTGMSSALCFRRQDDLIIDDDAEFVGHVVE